MAYVSYYACDSCGTEGYSMVNASIGLNFAMKSARKDGWKVGKRGWICAVCLAKEKAAKQEAAAKKRRFQDGV